MINQKLKCPQCGGEDVELQVELPKPSEFGQSGVTITPMSMDDWVNERTSMSIPAVYYMTREVAVCTRCGYKVERSR
jgi:C4-type Zn-finger protein